VEDPHPRTPFLLAIEDMASFQVGTIINDDAG
jgi:hypothetical protein